MARSATAATNFHASAFLSILSPAGLRKVGAAFDLSLAIAILVASKQVPGPREPILVCGELTLGGAVQPVPGTLEAAAAARRRGVVTILLPDANHTEASTLDGVGVSSLVDAARALGAAAVAAPSGRATLAVAAARAPGVSSVGEPAAVTVGTTSPWRSQLWELAGVRGDPVLKRALLVAAAGGHHLLLLGAPGTGKTMAARRPVSLLPPSAPRGIGSLHPGLLACGATRGCSWSHYVAAVPVAAPFGFRGGRPRRWKGASPV